ncbi:serine hydrolase domain-containing protein [Empedobacter brevis]|uniref:serine hydrolase domain-containing protein n=1 Tax=Empedobacter brevis TaxID=247 RepID=UPI0033410478
MKSRFFRIIVFILCFSIYSVSFSQVSDLDNRISRLDSLFGELNRYGEFNGNVLVAEKGNVIFHKSFGISDAENELPLHLNSIFNIGSITKHFTATAILLLAKEGKISYNDNISKYIPELSFYDRITIQNLIHHTSGLPDYTGLFQKGWEESKIVTNIDIIHRLQELKPATEFEPNEKFEYSNTGYLLLATIIEKISKQQFSDFLKEKIFIPLKMNQTSILFEYKDHLVNKNIAKSFHKDSSEIAYFRKFDGVYGQGRIYSTANDLFIWDRALKDNKFLNQEDKKEIFADSKLNSGESTSYGFGWFLSDDTIYGKIAYHSGYWSGYISQIDRHLDKDITIIILTNNDNRTDKKRMPINEVRKIIYNQSIEKTLRLQDDLLKKYSGVYVNDKGKDEKILFEHHSLWTKGFELIPISETKFKVNGFRPEVNYTFVIDSNGNVEKIRMEQIEQGVDEVFIRK